jgi:hypothetical protein
MFVLLCVTLVLSGCSTKASFNPKITAEEAEIIAATNIPYEIIRECDIYVLQPADDWSVIFLLRSDFITKSDLNWEENSTTTFEQQGLSKDGEYNLLLIHVDFNTGEILSKKATDSVILGHPDMFYKEPQPIVKRT